MKNLFSCLLLVLCLFSCKAVRIDGTTNTRIVNSTSDPVPVTIESTSDVQSVAVVSLPVNDKKGKPFVKTANNDEPIELTPSKGHYLIIDYLSAGIPSETLPKLTISTNGFTIDLPLQVKRDYYTYAERVQYIVLEGQKLTISTWRKGSTSENSNVYIAGNEVAN